MFKRILVPIDLHEPSSWQMALPPAVAQCRLEGGELYLMTVMPEFGLPIVAQYFPVDYEEKAQAQAVAKLKEISGKEVPGDVKVSHVVGHGTIYEQVLKAAQESQCDLIVMVAHRPALKSFLLGPNAARVARHAGCSVMVVRDYEPAS